MHEDFEAFYLRHFKAIKGCFRGSMQMNLKTIFRINSRYGISGLP